MILPMEVLLLEIKEKSTQIKTLIQEQMFNKEERVQLI